MPASADARVPHARRHAHGHCSNGCARANARERVNPRRRAPGCAFRPRVYRRASSLLLHSAIVLALFNLLRFPSPPSATPYYAV